MALSKLQLRDRQEWLNKLRTQVQSKKVVQITLKPNSPTLGQFQSFMGKDIECKLEGDVLTMAVVQKPEVPATTELVTKTVLGDLVSE